MDGGLPAQSGAGRSRAGDRARLSLRSSPFPSLRRTVQDGIFAIQDLAEHDLIAYPQHMVAGGRRPAAINRLRTEKPTADQTRKLDRMEEQNRQLRAVTMEVLAIAGKLRKGSIDRIMGMSDLELGLQALLAGRSSSRR